MNEWLTENANLIASLGAAATALVAFSVWCRRKIIRPIGDRMRKLDIVYETLGPNGGRSLYDRIVSIDRAAALSVACSRNLLNASDIGEFHTDAAGFCVFVNSAMCRFTRRPESDFIEQNWINVVHPDDRESVVRSWREAVRDRRVFAASYRWTDADDHPIQVKVNATPVVDSGRDLIGWHGTVRINGGEEPE